MTWNICSCYKQSFIHKFPFFFLESIKMEKSASLLQRNCKTKSVKFLFPEDVSLSESYNSTLSELLTPQTYFMNT